MYIKIQNIVFYETLLVGGLSQDHLSLEKRITKRYIKTVSRSAGIRIDLPIMMIARIVMIVTALSTFMCFGFLLIKTSFLKSDRFAL